MQKMLTFCGSRFRDMERPTSGDFVCAKIKRTPTQVRNNKRPLRLMRKASVSNAKQKKTLIYSYSYPVNKIAPNAIMKAGFAFGYEFDPRAASCSIRYKTT